MSRTREIIHKRHGMESKETLRKLVHEFPDNPAGMDYFYALFERAYCDGEPLHEGRPVVGTLCVQAPDELVRACGGAGPAVQRGLRPGPGGGGAPAGAQLPAGAGHPGGVREPGGGAHGSVEPGDQPHHLRSEEKAAEHIASLGYEVYSLEFPPVKHSEQAREYWRSSVRRFAHSLPRYTGRKLTRRRLRRALREVDRAQAEYRRLQRLRQARPTPLFGKDAFLVTGAYFFDDLGRWTEALRALNDELEQRVADGFAAAQSRAPRILFTGSPPIFPNLKLPMLIEQSGAIVVADEVCSANRMLHDRVAVDEWFLYDMVDAIADRYLKPCTCPIFDTSEDRRRRLLELARSHHVDGVVYQAFAGCQVYEMEHRAIAQALQAEQLPVMYIETDYSPDDMGQLSTRVEAFVESLKAKRRRRTA